MTGKDLERAVPDEVVDAELIDENETYVIRHGVTNEQPISGRLLAVTQSFTVHFGKDEQAKLVKDGGATFKMPSGIFCEPPETAQSELGAPAQPQLESGRPEARG